MEAYLDALGGNFSHGANFATTLSLILEQNSTLPLGFFSPFSLAVQLHQFLQLKNRSQLIYQQGKFYFFLSLLFHVLYVILIFSSFFVYWSLANYYISDLSDLSDIYMVKSVYSSIEARVQWSGSSLVTSFKLNSIFPCFMYSVYHSNVNHTRSGNYINILFDFQLM